MASVNYTICKYIYNNWILKSVSQRAFAKEHDIEESIVRKIKNTALKKDNYEYNIPVLTLQKICFFRNLKLHEFFKMVGM